MKYPTIWQRIMHAAPMMAIDLSPDDVQELARFAAAGNRAPLTVDRLLWSPVRCAAACYTGTRIEPADVFLLACDEYVVRAARQADEDQARADSAYVEISNPRPRRPAKAMTRRKDSPLPMPPPAVVAPTPPPPAIPAVQTVDVSIPTLVAWLRGQAGRAIVLTLERDGWRATAVVNDTASNTYIDTHSSGGPDIVGLPGFGAALESLDVEVAREALALVEATADHRRRHAELDLQQRPYGDKSR